MTQAALFLALVLDAGVAAGAQAPPSSLPARPSAQPASAADEQALRTFRERLDEYVALRLSLEKKLETPAVQTDVRLVREREQTLADAVRAARRAARQGDFFIPAVRPLVARAVTEELSDKATREAVREADPAREARGRLELAVHASYPEAAPWTTVPPSLLARLPALTDDLQYRFAGRALLLVDTRARLLLDFLPEIAPR